MAMARYTTTAMLGCLLLAALPLQAAGKRVTVNWVTPRPQLEGQYTQSATICKGDIVTFTWATALPHNLGKATSGFYSRCAGRGWSRISPDVTSYRKSIKFNTVGTSYYVCSYSNHCKIGHKMQVTVVRC